MSQGQRGHSQKINKQMVSSICIFSKFDANICTCIFSRVLKLGYRQSVMNKLKGEKMDMTQTICKAKFLSCST